MSAAHFLTPALAAPGGWGLKVERTGQWLATDAELAGSSESRRKGLLGQDGLRQGQALVIAPTQGVHTFGMRFPIDVVGVSRRGMVVSVKEALPARRILFSWRAFAIVELASGAARAANLEIGDRLVVSTDLIPLS
jgi:uncharacterized membrane protein (UPF0127 family)